MTSNERYHWGLDIRQQIMGPGHVEAAMPALADLDDDLQSLKTEVASGDVWSRPGPDRRSRSIMTVAMLIALNRPAELKVHIVAALNIGVSIETLREMVLHSAVYCGFPAALHAMRLLQEAVQEKPSTARTGKISYFHGEEVFL